MVAIMTSYPLALMTSNGAPGEVPFATHLPVITDPELINEKSADLSGSTLVCHMNRANPHWSAIEDGSAVLLTFSGPHAYVSPTIYEINPAAPTWNFTSVHVRGTVEKVVSIEETLGVVQATVRAFEGKFGNNWDMTGSVGYFRQIVPGVGAFRVLVTGADGMFKLSQEQCPEVQDRVQLSFSQNSCTRHREVAGLMDRLTDTR